MSSAELPQRSDFGFFVRLVVRWGDMDTLGHINNAHFFTYDEQARLEYFASIGESVPGYWTDSGLILARIGCDFLKQVRHPATLDVGFRIARMGRSSMESIGGLFQGEQLVAVTRGVVVWFDYASQKPTAIPDNVRALIRARELKAPLE